MVGSWGVVVDRGVVGSRGRGVVDRGVVRGGGGGVVDSLPFICYIRDKTAVVVSMVFDVLCAAIREQDRVGTLNVPVSVRDLASVKVGSVVIIVNSILVLVGTRFLLVDRGGGVVIGGGRRVVVGGVANHPADNSEYGEKIQQCLHDS